MALDFSVFDKKKKPEESGLDFSMFKQPITDVMGGGMSKPSNVPITASLAVRNNNPGNLRLAGQPGAIQGEKGFAKFATPQAGLAALERDVSAKITGKSVTGLKPTDTILKFASVYAPKSDGNDPVRYAKHIANELGVDINTSLGSLTSRARDIALAITKMESPDFLAYITGAKTAQASTAPLPKEVEHLDFSMFGTEKKTTLPPGVAREVASLKGGYLTDVFGTGLVWGSGAQKVDPTLPGPEKNSGTANSTPQYITQAEKDELRLLPKPVTDFVDALILKPAASTYLSAMNTLFTTGRALGETALSRKDNPLNQMFPKATEWMNETINKPLVEETKKQINLIDNAQQNIALSVADGEEGISSWRELMYAWGNTGMSMGLAVGLGLATRSTKVSAATLSAMESSSVYNEARGAGKTPEDALKIAAASGVGTYLLEKWGFDYLFGMSGAKTLAQWTVNGLKQGAAETLQEEAQTVWQNVVKKYGYDGATKWYEGMYDTAVATFVPSMIIGMATPGTADIMNRADVLKKIQKDAGVNQSTADRSWKVMQYATKNLLDSIRLRGMSIEAQGAPSEPAVDSSLAVKSAKQVEGAQQIGATKPLIRTQTGQTDTSRVFERTEKQLLKQKLSVQQQKGNIVARMNERRTNLVQSMRERQGTIDDRKKMLLEYAKTNVPQSERGRVMTMINNVTGVKGAWKAYSRMDNIITEYEKNKLRNDTVSQVKKLLSSPSVAIDYKKQITELMSFYELKGHTDKTIERLKSLREFVNKKVEAGEEVTVPMDVLDSLDLLMKKQVEDISLREMRNINAKVRLLGELGKTKWRLIGEATERKKEIIRDELVAGTTAMERNEIVQPKPGENISRSKKFHDFIARALNKAQDIDMALTPTDVLMDVLDGGNGTYDGPNSTLIKGTVDANYGTYLDLKDALQAEVYDLAKDLKEENFRRMGIVAAYEQDGGMEKLVNLGYTEAEVQAIKLTSEERKALDKMRETMDSQFPHIQRIMREVYNQDVQKVKNYFSFMTDFTAMEEWEVRDRFGDKAIEFHTPPTKTVQKKFTKSRVGAGEQKININAMQVFARHIDNVAYFRTMARDTKMLFEAVNSEEYRNAAGPYGQLLVKEWLDVIARKGGTEGANQIALLDVLRRNISAGILGLKLSTIVIQPTALIDGMGINSIGSTLKATNEIMTNREARNFILTKFPELRDRTGGEVAIRELVEDQNLLKKMQEVGFMPMQYVDKLTAASVALAAYRTKMTELGLEVDYSAEPNQEAMAYAEFVTRRTQASSLFKDLPLALSRGKLTGNRSLDRAILQFQTFMLYRWSRIRHDAIRVGINTKNPRHAARVMTPMILAALAASGIRTGLSAAMDAITGGGDGDDEEAIAAIQSGTIRELLGTVPFLGNLFGTFMYGNDFFPILDAPQSVVEDLNTALFAKEPETRARGWAKVLTNTGTLLGVPGSVQAQQLLMDTMEKSGDPSGINVDIPNIDIPDIKIPDVKIPDIKI